ncbi:hypothetical protein G9A89_003863 [Geosiphon pyriformis]|nr:hypothetical protein G9A89_003863 [Geosiphon pyriformis]
MDLELKVAESEIIGTNHLGFAKSLFQQYSQQLSLTNNYYSAESTFNFYINEKITDCLGGTVNIELARENFYKELFQHTRKLIKPLKSIPNNNSPLPTQTKAKKNCKFQQKKPELNHSPIHHTIIYQEAPSTSYQQKIIESEEEEEEEKESEDQEFTYQNLITENSEFGTPNLQTQQTSNLENPKIETLNFQTQPNQNAQNPDFNNQQHLPPVIVINPPLAPPNAQEQQQPQPLLQQQIQQQPQPNLDPMAYAPIAKLEKFTSEENNAQVWLNNVEKAIATNG